MTTRYEKRKALQARSKVQMTVRTQIRLALLLNHLPSLAKRSETVRLLTGKFVEDGVMEDIALVTDKLLRMEVIEDFEGDPIAYYEARECDPHVPGEPDEDETDCNRCGTSLWKEKGSFGVRWLDSDPEPVPFPGDLPPCEVHVPVNPDKRNTYCSACGVAIHLIHVPGFLVDPVGVMENAMERKQEMLRTGPTPAGTIATSGPVEGACQKCHGSKMIPDSEPGHTGHVSTWIDCPRCDGFGNEPIAPEEE